MVKDQHDTTGDDRPGRRSDDEARVRETGTMDLDEPVSADVHRAARTAFDSLLLPNGFRRTADWINTGEHEAVGREYSRERVRVRIDWDRRDEWLDVRLAMARPGRRRVLGWENLEAVAGAPSGVRHLSEAEQLARVNRLVALAREVLQLGEGRAD